MKKFLLFILLISPGFAFAVPLPQMATAIIGVSEIFLVFLTVLAIYFPFARKLSGKNILIYIILLISVGFNFHFLFPMSEMNSVKEDRPGMLWTEEERLHDKYSIPEEEAYQLMANNPQYIFADVRNLAEKELGSAIGFKQVPWAELAQNKESLNGKTVVVTCWTGMRGSEVCSKLRALGIDCRYLRGGLKRWTELGLPTQINGSKEFFGSIPYFDNADKYLTPEETKFHIAKKALIIDGRSEEEFKKSHIDNAINIPFMDITTAELNYKIAGLPVSREGLIVSCFGLVSCSEASSLGWEFNKLGFKYLGAYGGGAELLKDNTSWVDKIGKDIQNGVKFWINHYPKITTLLLFSILMSLWIVVKKTTELSFTKEENQFKNLILKLTPTILTIIYYFIALNLSEILIIESNYIYIQLIGSIIVGFSMFKLFKLETKILLLISVVLSYLLIVKMKPSLVLILGVIIFVELLFQESIKLIKSIIKNIKKRKIFINLIDVKDFIGDSTKAGKLSLFLNKGYRVPEGFVVIGKNIDKINDTEIELLKKRLGEEIAVRSTASNEDSILSSQAGVNLSIVPSNVNNMKRDIRAVLKSYKSKNEKNEIVLLQKIIKPKLAGVMFSKNPNQGGTILIEFCEGLSEDLMSGKKKAQTTVLNRINGQVVKSDNELLTPYIQELYTLIKNLEKDFKCPVDIEWAIDESGLWLIQVRYQTGLQNLYVKSIEQDKDKIAHLEIVDFNLNEFSMILKNISPLSASLMENNWKNNGIISHVAKMAYWKWNNKSSQNYYQYAFRQMWATSYPLFQSPNKISWWLSKLVFNQNWSEMSEIKKDIMKKFIVYKNIDFDNLNNTEIIDVWKELVSFWKELQGQAFYAYLMALSSLFHTEKFLQELTLPSYDYKDYAYFSDKEYFLEKERNIEVKENLKEDLFLKLNNQVSVKCSNMERKNIIFSRQLIILRETSKYDMLKWFYLLRKCLLSMKTRLNLGDEFWNLKEEEVEQIFVNKDILKLLNNRTYEINISLPENLNANNLLNLNPVGERIQEAIFVSTPKEIKGEIIWIKNLDSVDLETEVVNSKGKIIYVEYMTPGLVLLCKKHGIANICSYYGSMLSHPSVLARENEITCLVGLDLSKEKYVNINN